MYLSDGSMIPSNLTADVQYDAAADVHSNHSLKSGIVTKIYYPDDQGNISKRHLEYDVNVAEFKAAGGASVLTYRNCRQVDVFGNINDHLNYTLEISQNDKEKDGGARVLLLCIDGINVGGNAVIIGGLTDHNREGYKRADGKFYDFQFNGLDININKDGEYTITYNSPIDLAGKKAFQSAAGSKIKIDKDGGITLSTNEGQFLTLNRASKIIELGDGKNSITLDKGNEQIGIFTSGDASISADKQLSLFSKNSTSIESSADISIKSATSAALQSGTSMDIKAGTTLNIKAGASGTIQAGPTLTVKSDGITTVKGQLLMLNEGSAPIALVGISQVIGLGNLGVPVVSQIITGSTTILGS